jgi:predicted cupin superfamily sugar epimerase
VREAKYWIEKLALVQHPEGGYYRETYRSAETIPQSGLPGRFDGPRTFSTAIYFLLPAGEISALHRIKSDEVWHFYDGGSLTIHVLSDAGEYAPIELGSEAEHQAVVAAGCWFGAEVRQGDFVLAGCTVAPGFDFRDFEMADRFLCSNYPAHRALIERLTKPSAGG